MSTTRLPELLKKSKPQILEEWLRQQLASSGARADLIKDGELRKQSESFLDQLQRSVQSGESADIKTAAWAPTLELLGDLTRQRERMGFSPSETATFIFSLKEPLLLQVRTNLKGEPEAVIDESMGISSLLDKLGLYTTEVYQASREEVIRRQQEELLELSTPVVKMWDGIVALPLIGTLDSARTSVVMESLLQRIVETGSEIAIIDITGVPTVDTLVAQHLLKTVAAARLMGADCIISGIRPQIAQTMVHLAIDLSAVTTKATMAEALKSALLRTGHRVVKEGGAKA
ncbi:STAS domain-containing protein [Prosthecobacter sp.]|uniref:STAS domain-containing protein n=1 Tax=Prosthecobacter sp. TaxID=1965333 RepID=UPI0037834FD8